MKKFTFLMITAICLSLSSFSQSVQEKIERQAKDPKTAENAAKADVFVSRNKSIFDSTTAGSSEKVKATNKRKKKNCRKRG